MTTNRFLEIIFVKELETFSGNQFIINGRKEKKRRETKREMLVSGVKFNLYLNLHKYFFQRCKSRD